VPAPQAQAPLAYNPNAFARQLFAGLPSRYDVLAEVLSFGQNRRWRRALVDAVAAELPGRVLDVATGTAGVALQLAGRCGARVVGVDLSPEMLKAGAGRVAASPERARVALAVARGEELPFPDASFDALSFTYLLRYVADPAATLRELARVVKPGGIVANLEFGVPSQPPWDRLWRLYTRFFLPTAGFVLGKKEWYEVGKFLGPSITSYYERHPLAWHQGAWRAAGLVDVELRRMSLGGGVVMWGRRGSRAVQLGTE